VALAACIVLILLIGIASAPWLDRASAMALSLF